MLYTMEKPGYAHLRLGFVQKGKGWLGSYWFKRVPRTKAGEWKAISMPISLFTDSATKATPPANTTCIEWTLGGGDIGLILAKFWVTKGKPAETELVK